MTEAKILVVGTGSEPLPDQQRWVASNLGRALCLAGFDLVVGGWKGVDSEVAQGFFDGCRDDARLTRVVQQDAVLGNSHGRVLRVRGDIAEWVEAINQSHAVVLLGGLGGTFESYVHARKRRVPVIPLPGTGGDARKAFRTIIDRWETDALFKNVSLTRFRALDVPVDVPSDVDRAIESAVSVLEQELGGVQPLEFEQKRRCLIATAKADLSFVGHEGHQITKVLAGAGAHVEVPPHRLTTDLFSSLLRNGDFDVLHYAGHAGVESLQFDEGEAYAQGLVATIRECQSLKLVFLNGCATRGIAERLTSTVNQQTRPIPFVVGTCADIVDEAACHLAVDFYRLLSGGETLGTALRHARNSTDMKFAASSGKSNRRHVAAAHGPLAGHSGEALWFVSTSYDTAVEIVLWSRPPKAESGLMATGASTGSTVLYLTSNPIGTASAHSEEVYQAVLTACAPALAVQRAPFHLNDVKDLLGDMDPQLVHFSCPGVRTGLIVEDENGDAQELKADSVRKTLSRSGERRLRVVVAGAQNADLWATALLEISECVVAMGEPPRAAQLPFFVTFYARLSLGLSVASAFEDALNLARGVSPRGTDDDLFSLFCRDGVDPSSIVVRRN